MTLYYHVNFIIYYFIILLTFQKFDEKHWPWVFLGFCIVPSWIFHFYEWQRRSSDWQWQSEILHPTYRLPPRFERYLVGPAAFEALEQHLPWMGQVSTINKKQNNTIQQYSRVLQFLRRMLDLSCASDYDRRMVRHRMHFMWGLCQL